MAKHTEQKEKVLSSHTSFHFPLGENEVSNHQISSLLGLFFLRGQETKEFKLIRLEKLINAFTDLEVRNNPLKRNGVNLEILNTKIKEPEEI